MSVVDVIVVSYNSRERLRPCVDPFLGDKKITVIVVDNASPDADLEAVADLPVVALAETINGGYARGCNVGWRSGRAPFVLFLNPDTATTAAAVHTLASVLERDPAVGAVGPRIAHGDGSIDFSLRRFPRVRSTYAQALFLHRLFPRSDWADEVDRDPARYETAGEAEWISGAAIMVRRTLLERIGGWDETYFHYGEDMDLCRRIRSLGFSVRYEPAARVVHEGGGSAPRAALLPLLASNRIRYAAKHRGRTAAILERGGVALNSVTHAALGRGGAVTRKGHIAALRAALAPLEPAARQMARLS
jgi:GT2 family glycosyltransferase